MGKVHFLTRVSHLDAHHRLFLSSAAGIFTVIISPGSWPIETRLVSGYNVYTLLFNALCWILMLKAKPREVQRKAGLEDVSRQIIFSLVLLGSLASITTVIYLLHIGHDLSSGMLHLHQFLSAFAVISSWCLTHTIFALHYARLYYGPNETGSDCHKGLDFPHDIEPDYLDFAYFSFILGMTCQVSDVVITSRRLRRQGLLHGLISFGFNTIIVALSVNVITGMV